MELGDEEFVSLLTKSETTDWSAKYECWSGEALAFKLKAEIVMRGLTLTVCFLARHRSFVCFRKNL